MGGSPAARGRDPANAAATVVEGGLGIARFFLETVADGDLTRIRHRPTWANGRPAVTIHLRAADGTWVPHGISVLGIQADQIASIDAFLDPALLPRFGLTAGREEPPLAAVAGPDAK